MSAQDNRQGPKIGRIHLVLGWTPRRHRDGSDYGHAWERGTNENTNGLVRQYVPKQHSMAHLTQHDCTALARKLNRRPRKRLGYRTPEECYVR